MNHKTPEGAFAMYTNPPGASGPRNPSRTHELQSMLPQHDAERNANDEVLRMRQTARHIADGLYELHYGIPTDRVIPLAIIQNELTRHFVHTHNAATADLKHMVEEHMRRKGEAGTPDSPGSKDRGAMCRTLTHTFFEGTGPYLHNHAIRGAREEARYITTRANALGILGGREKETRSEGLYYDLSANAHLDAHHAVDLTEVTYELDTNGAPVRVTSLRLVQIKAHVPLEHVPALVETIHAKHTRYAASLARFPLERFDLTGQMAAEQHASEDVQRRSHEFMELLGCALDTPQDAAELRATARRFLDWAGVKSLETRINAYECLYKYVTGVDTYVTGAGEDGPLKTLCKEIRRECETARATCLREQKQIRRERREVLVPVAQIQSVTVCNGTEYVREIPIATSSTEAVGLGYHTRTT